MLQYSTVRDHDDLVGNAVRVIRERLESDPRRYLSYGPYWWAIKKVLVDNGVPLGKVDDEKVRLAYTGTTDEETIVMAEEFSQIRQEPSPLMTWTTHPMPRQSILADR